VTDVYPVFDPHKNFIGYRWVQKMVPLEENLRETPAPLINNELDRKTLNPLEPPMLKKRKPNLKEQQKDDSSKVDDVDSLLLLDENTRIVDCTTAVHGLLGYTREELLNLTLSDFDALETPQSIKEKLKEAKKHGSITLKTIHKRKDGSSLLVQEHIDYLKDKNLFQCMVKKEEH
jgi:PAS domain S-box-containing protein